MPDTLRAYTVKLSSITIQTTARNSDAAVEVVLKAEGAPFSALQAVYQDDPVPKVNCRYGAPLGRGGDVLSHDGKWKADFVPLDEGYDDGGAYWGIRPRGLSLFAVQDGHGNIAFFDAPSSKAAIEQAMAA
jgi:hypothetical protein